ncbi:MAG TPA: RluA family pseudouridine synthase [Acidimicrobiales bacterium]|nr:RluA family pseudouridine synthase [Acidimicrobiales bacterium]
MSHEGSTGAGSEDRQLDLEVPRTLDGQRIDRSIAMLTGLARRAAADLVTEGRATVDGAVVRTRSHSLVAGQRLHVAITAAPPSGPVADASVEFAVVAEDRQIVVIDKPAGLVVHHGAGHGGATLVDGLLARYPDLAAITAGGIGDPGRPGIVHRLDKGTSGLMVVARTPEAFESLTRQFRDHRAARAYLALVMGVVGADQGVIDAPIGRSAREPTRMAVRSGGRPARTTYRVRDRFSSPTACTLIEAELETGRTHQVRVHLNAIGHPVVGDIRYGGGRARPEALAGLLVAGRIFLHAYRLSIDHPDGGRFTWECELPADLRQVLALFTT